MLSNEILQKNSLYLQIFINVVKVGVFFKNFGYGFARSKNFIGRNYIKTLVMRYKNVKRCQLQCQPRIAGHLIMSS